MNVVTTIWRQLVRRRLWPVAVLLLAALVAVPVLLAREPAVAARRSLRSTVTAEADDTHRRADRGQGRRRRTAAAAAACSASARTRSSPAPVKKPKVEQPDDARSGRRRTEPPLR